MLQRKQLYELAVIIGIDATRPWQLVCDGFFDKIEDPDIRTRELARFANLCQGIAENLEATRDTLLRTVTVTSRIGGLLPSIPELVLEALGEYVKTDDSHNGAAVACTWVVHSHLERALDARVPPSPTHAAAVFQPMLTDGDRPRDPTDSDEEYNGADYTEAMGGPPEAPKVRALGSNTPTAQALNRSLTAEGAPAQQGRAPSTAITVMAPTGDLLLTSMASRDLSRWVQQMQNVGIDNIEPYVNSEVAVMLDTAGTHRPELSNWRTAPKLKVLKAMREAFLKPIGDQQVMSMDEVCVKLRRAFPRNEQDMLAWVSSAKDEFARVKDVIDELMQDRSGQLKMRKLLMELIQKAPPTVVDSFGNQKRRLWLQTSMRDLDLPMTTPPSEFLDKLYGKYMEMYQAIAVGYALDPHCETEAATSGRESARGYGKQDMQGRKKENFKKSSSGSQGQGGGGSYRDALVGHGSKGSYPSKSGGGAPGPKAPQTGPQAVNEKNNAFIRKLMAQVQPQVLEQMCQDDPALSVKVYNLKSADARKYGAGAGAGTGTGKNLGQGQGQNQGKEPTKKFQKGKGKRDSSASKGRCADVEASTCREDGVPVTSYDEPLLTATFHSTSNYPIPPVTTPILLDSGAQVNTVGEDTDEGALARTAAHGEGERLTICSPLKGTCVECGRGSLEICICNEKGGELKFKENFYILPESNDKPIIGYPTMVREDLVRKNPSLFRPPAKSAEGRQKCLGGDQQEPDLQNANTVLGQELYEKLSKEEKAAFRKRRRRTLRRMRVKATLQRKRQLRDEVYHALESREVEGGCHPDQRHREVGEGGTPRVRQISRRPTPKTAGRRGDRRPLSLRTGGDRLGRKIPGGVKRRLRTLRRVLAKLEAKVHPTSGVDNTPGKADRNTTNPRHTPSMSGTVCHRDELLTGLDEPTLAATAEEEWMDKRELHLSEEGSPEELIEFHGTPELVELLKRVCAEHDGVFRSSVSETPAGFREEFEIEVDEEAWMAIVSGKERMRTQSPEKQAEIERQVQELLRRKVIERCNEARFSHVVLARKPNGKWRFCIDYRQLNICSGSLGWPIPKIKEILLRLGDKKAKFFGVIDMTAGYHQASLHPDSRKFTTFRTHSGTYQWTRVPFGLKGAPSYYQAQMAHALEGLLYDVCELYIDDIIVHGQTEAEFAANLAKVLRRLQERGITVNPAKCRLGVPEVEYVGHVISETGLTMSDSKKKKVLDFPLPETRKQLRGFLGLVNYFRDHIRGHAVICYPLHQLVAQSSGKHLQWTPVCIKAFQEIKDAVAELQTLFFPVEDAPVYLHTDACKYGVGAYVFQVIHGVERPIGFYSKSLKGAELNWSTIEQECYAIMCAVREFDYLLRFRKFVLRTDHHNLIEMNVSRAAKVMRWKMELLEYDFDIEHIAGEENIVADGLSRFVSDLGKDPAVGAKRSHEGGITTTPVMLARLRVGYNTVDDTIMTVSRALSRLHLPPEELTLSPAVRATIAKYHNSVSGHHGVESTLKTMRRHNENWKHMARDVKRFIRQCPTCQKNRTIPFNGITEAFTLSTYDGPMRHLSMDIVGPFPEDIDGNQHVLVMIDRFSRFVTLWAMKDQTATSVASKVLMHAGTFGTPDTIGTDGGPCFVSEVFDELLELADIKHMNITPYSHEENGMVERSIRTLQEHLRAFLFDKEIKHKWSIVLPMIQRIMNASIHSAIQCCPAQLVFTNALDLDRHIIHEPLVRDTISLPEWHRIVVESQASLIVAVQKLLMDVDEAHRIKRQRPGQIEEYQVGSYVLVQHVNGRGRPPTKTHMLWLGPYRVVKVTKDQVTVQDVIHGRTRQVHVKATRPFQMDPGQINPVEIRRRDNDEFMVERILDHVDNTPAHVQNKPRKNDLSFKVRWLGYEEKYDSWEPWNALCNNICLHRYLHNLGLDRLIPKDQRRVDYDIRLEDLAPPQWE